MRRASRRPGEECDHNLQGEKRRTKTTETGSSSAAWSITALELDMHNEYDLKLYTWISLTGLADGGGETDMPQPRTKHLPTWKTIETMTWCGNTDKGTSGKCDRPLFSFPSSLHHRIGKIPLRPQQRILKSHTSPKMENKEKTPINTDFRT